MALYKQQFVIQGTNGSDLVAAHDWASALRVRMTEQQEYRYKACNTLRIVNNSAQDATLSFTWDVARTDSIRIKGNSVFNLSVEDGRAFYGFDIYSADAALDIAAGDIKYSMASVAQIPER